MAHEAMTTRRDLFRGGLAVSAAAGLSLLHWQRAFAAPAMVGPSPYGPLRTPDVNGVALPESFSARLIAKTGEIVAGTSYEWHGQPDGGATFPTEGGGWVYVSNAELNGTRGGVGAIRFDPGGTIVDAYPILGGTKWNCAGGATPWNTWLSCEEWRGGFVWECNPYYASQGVPLPALGKFAHEAAVVDPGTGYVYLTEDDYKSRFYRFRPRVPGKLRDGGILEAASVASSGAVTWIEVSPDRPARDRNTTVFERGEGAWFSAGHVYFCTTADNRVWALDTATDRIEIIYDAALLGPAAPLRDPDNVTVHERSGDIYVAEDADDLQLVLLADATGRRIAAPFLQLYGHDGSEVAGPAFSPDGSRLYVTSQRGTDGDGMTFEITGPFRNAVR